MLVNDCLALRRTERQILLEKAVALLQGDSRVRAAWLFGSMGRGTHDALSDIDLCIVVADKYRETLNAGRIEFARTLGEPLLTVEAPQNAPPGGAYLLVMYAGSPEAGPQFLDISWQPEGGTIVPEDAHLLFNRMQSGSAGPGIYDETKATEPTARSQTVFFWMMLPFAAKYVARRDCDQAANMVRLLRYTLGQVRELSGITALAPTNEPPREAGAQLNELGDLAHAMESMSHGSELEDYASREALLQVRAALDLAAAMLDIQA